MVAALLFSAPVSPAAAADQPASTHPLLDAWFVLEESGPVYAPYAYLRHRDASAAQLARKRVLLKELDGLVRHLNLVGNQALARSMTRWRNRIDAADTFRTPGQWGPAALLSSTRNGVPTAAVAAIGACQVPGWIEIWSARGVRRIAWQPAMHLQDLTADKGALQAVNAQSVTLVTPYGKIIRRGIAAWNYHDAPLVPGMRIVVPLPLEGQVAVWMQQYLPVFLAHLAPGDDCREMRLAHDAENATD